MSGQNWNDLITNPAPAYLYTCKWCDWKVWGNSHQKVVRGLRAHYRDEHGKLPKTLIKNPLAAQRGFYRRS
jgi:hypothetical protein